MPSVEAGVQGFSRSAHGVGMPNTRWSTRVWDGRLQSPPAFSGATAGPAAPLTNVCFWRQYAKRVHAQGLAHQGQFPAKPWCTGAAVV